MIRYKKWLLFLMGAVCMSVCANEPAPEPNEPTHVAALTAEEVASIEDIKPAVPEEKIDYFLYRLHKYLADGTLLIVVESDRIRIPLLINKLRMSLSALTEIAHTQPDLYEPFLHDIAERYAGLADAVPEMTYFESKWWQKQLLASALRIKGGRNKAVLNNLDLTVLDSFAEIYQDLARIVTPAAYVSRAGSIEEQVKWWWAAASHDQQVMGAAKGLGFVMSVVTAIVIIVKAFLEEDPKEKKTS